MNIRQTNIDNVGIVIGDDEIFPGYNPKDGMHFTKTSPNQTQHELYIMHASYKPLATSLIESYPSCQKLLDVGSGAGSLTYWMRQLKSDLTIVTLDGNPQTVNSKWLKKDHHFIVRTDVDYTLVDDQGETILFDVITSFEHFEHIQPETFETFLNNIKKHCHKDTIIIASASKHHHPKPEDAHIHCNVQTQEAWDKYLKNLGWKLLPEKYITNTNHPFNFNIAISSQLTFRLS